MGMFSFQALGKNVVNGASQWGSVEWKMSERVGSLSPRLYTGAFCGVKWVSVFSSVK